MAHWEPIQLTPTGRYDENGNEMVFDDPGFEPKRKPLALVRAQGRSPDTDGERKLLSTDIAALNNGGKVDS